MHPGSAGLAAISWFLRFVGTSGYGYDAQCSCTECPALNNIQCQTFHERCTQLAPDSAQIEDQVCLSGDTHYKCLWSESTDYIGHCPQNVPSYDSECDRFCDRQNCSYSYECNVWPEDDDDKEWCFHVDTVLGYKDKIYTFTDLLQGIEKECTIPHVVTTKGFVVHTSCGKNLRLTGSHLVATPEGHKTVRSLVEADAILVHDSADQCPVTKIEREETDQQYFGLNCLYSTVAANGLTVSTFGDLHVLPAVYMYAVGSVVGVDLASRIGIHISGFYHRYTPKFVKKLW